MFSKIISATAATTISCLLAVTSASAEQKGLTKEQIFTAWGQMSNLTAEFTQVNDGELRGGRVWMADPTLIVMYYTTVDGQVGDILVMHGGDKTVTVKHLGDLQVGPKMTMVYDAKYGNWSVGDIGAIGRILKVRPAIDEGITGNGATEYLTSIRLRDPMNKEAGCADLTFDNQNRHLVKLETYQGQCGKRKDKVTEVMYMYD